jgi:hypothetical protein
VFAFDSSGSMADTAAVTDSDGRYTLNNGLSPGTYTLAIPPAFSRGYAPANSTLTLPAAGAADFVLDASGAITGRVVNSAGEPVEGASIHAISKDLDPAETQLSRFLRAGVEAGKTDQGGAFAINSGIGSGTYIVTASLGSLPARSSTETEAGGRADIVLDFSKIIRVTGRIMDADGRPIEGASVVPSFASAISGAGLFAAKTGTGGEYELVVPLRDNNTMSLFEEVTASAAGYASATAPAGQDIELEAAPATKITGVVIAQKPLSPPVETVLTRKGAVVFEHEGTQYRVGLQTNARMLDASFDPSSRSISIDMEGVQDAAGRSEFSIPKEFMAGPFAVSLDGGPAQAAAAAENQTHSVISIDHEHDLQEITIQGATAVPEFPIPAVLAAAGVAATIAWKRLRR